MPDVPEELSAENLQFYTDWAIARGLEWGPNLLLALLVLLLGLWIINRIVRLVAAGLGKSNTDVTLAKFLSSLTSVILKALLLVSVAGMIGIETTSFIAILGAAGLAIGLALQGSLSNFAGGVLILLFRPFKVGDFIDAQSVSGTVAEIQIFNTIIRTGDFKRVIIPNGSLSNGIITNFSAEAKRRVDFVFGIGYDDDIDLTKQVLRELLAADERIHTDPAPIVVLSELADSSVNFTVRAWVDSANYWPVFWETTEAVKKAFDAQDISIPYPQQDVHLHQASR